MLLVLVLWSVHTSNKEMKIKSASLYVACVKLFVIFWYRVCYSTFPYYLRLFRSRLTRVVIHVLDLSVFRGLQSSDFLELFRGKSHTLLLLLFFFYSNFFLPVTQWAAVVFSDDLWPTLLVMEMVTFCQQCLSQQVSSWFSVITERPCWKLLMQDFHFSRNFLFSFYIFSDEVV